MGSYVVLARKYRSAQFSDIVGQTSVVRTLMNAIKSDRIHHAYLLTGSRGIGKTSIARIFAKALRCENSKWIDGKDGPWLESCGECSSCREIAAGNSVDVIEIDGASNNGVDAVREIRENAKYLPSSGTRKIYVIDEVHMLTTAAFNALLKTLEEPPAHVVFILATTEAHKIPSTILSRCQRFDLKRITTAQIQGRLAEVAKAEKLAAEPAALALLARAAEGSMRDALSLFDQVIAYGGENISAQAVRESIGLVESQSLLGILRGIFERDPKRALALIDEAYGAGHDLKLIARSLIEYLHAALLSKLGLAVSGNLQLSEEEIAELREIAAKRSIEEIELFFQAFQQGTDWIARSPQPKIVLEVLVIKCATAEALYSPSTGSSPVSSGPTGSTAKPVAGGGTIASAAAPTQASAPTANATKASVGSEPAGANAGDKPIFHFSKPAAAATAVPANAAPTGTYRGPKSWEAFIDFVKPKRPLLAKVLEHASCDRFPTQVGEDFVVCFGEKDAVYYKEQLATRVYQDQLVGLTQEFFGQAMRLQVEVRAQVESLAGKREKAREEEERSAKDTVENHPVIVEARSLFGGELGPIEFTPKSEANPS